MIKSGSTVFIKDTYLTNYLFAVDDLNNSTGHIIRKPSIATKENAYYFTFNVVYSVGNDKDHLYIGDTVKITTFNLQSDIFYVGANFLLSKTNYNSQFVICTDNTYCRTDTDPNCYSIYKGSDIGKPICLSTKFYLFSPEYNSPIAFPLGYVVFDDANGSYGVDHTYDYPQKGIAQFVIIPKEVSYCDGANCVYFTDYDNYLSITCDSSCNCTTSNGSKVYSDQNCNCSVVTKYSCNGNKCVEDNNGKYDNKDCNGDCEYDPLTRFDCNSDKQCVPTPGGKYYSYDCEGNCKAPSVQKYKCDGNACIIADENGPYTTKFCDHKCGVITKYSCQNGKCTQDPNGTFDTQNCNNTCTNNSNDDTKKNNKDLIIVLVILGILIIGGLSLFWYIKRRK